MSRAIERGKAIISEMIEGLQADIDEADLVRTFKDYLVDQQYVTEEESASLPNSAKQICDSLALRFGWSIAHTADMLFDFGIQSGIDQESYSGSGTNWRYEGF
jgi:hypothetical protein